MERISPTTPVVVVGAGPVGLMLAGELRLGGAEVIVLEKLDAPMTESRASTLHARTMEILDSRGLLESIGKPPNDKMGHFGGLPLDLTLPSPYPGQWKVAQTQLEPILQQWASSLGADIRRGHEVIGVAAGEGKVEIQAIGPKGPVRIEASYVVACDGENSIVRRLLGVDFPHSGLERVMIRADVAGIHIPNRRFQRLAKGLAIAARREDGVTRVMVHEFGRMEERGAAQATFSEVADIWMRVTGEDIRGGTPLWVNSFSDGSCQLTHYRHGRILFAGDAAHRQMPIGGQALNLGLQDAVNLGWKLALCVRGRASDELLDTYHHERHAVGESVLSNIKAQAMLLLGGPEVESVRNLMGKLITHGDVRTELASMISGLDVRYDVGTNANPLLGARMPHVELTTKSGTTRTPALLRGGRGVLLIFANHDKTRFDRLATQAAPWAGHIQLIQAKALPNESLVKIRAVLIRPDGHVVWTEEAGTDSSDLTAALHRWFGPPADSIRKSGEYQTWVSS
ncbi:FAD-dependent monooxygenase [Pendulispora brunnea]|uniref:FAD-dependent monooxygenase n=1 Tax=Pendulispora brunnea TaxID=2905690 RepID=A0ABZ2K0F8_9BACT